MNDPHRHRFLIPSLIALLMLCAAGGFGAPLSCEGKGQDDCRESWAMATSNALACAGMISALLARVEGQEDPHDPDG